MEIEAPSAFESSSAVTESRDGLLMPLGSHEDVLNYNEDGVLVELV